jgi:hypothetical protein
MIGLSNLSIGIGRRRHGSGGGGVSGMHLGENISFWQYYIYQHLPVDITRGGAIQVVGGTLDGQGLPDSHRDSEGYPSSLPADATGVSIVFHTPEISEGYALTWSVGGTGTGTPTILSHGGFTAFGTVSGNSLSLTPGIITSGAVVNFIHYALPGDGSYPKRFICRPNSDPGGTFGATVISKLQSLSASSGPVRVVHLTGSEYNGGVNNTATIKFPQDGDGQLVQPILTSSNRNTVNSAEWSGSGQSFCYRDGVPWEHCFSLASTAGRDLWYNVHWNCDDTNADGSPKTSTYLTALAAQAATFCATGRKLYIEASNEVWNFFYRVASQAQNEANYRGQAADCHTAVVVVATSNITLSGTQTIDGVAVVAGNRVLVAGQTTASQNGVYVCAAGAWSRAADTISPADKWFVSSGTAHANTTWFVKTPGTITLGTTALSILQFAREQRLAEKSGQIWSYFVAAFNTAGVPLSRLVRVLGWQAVSDTTAFQNMLDYCTAAGITVDALSSAPYFDAVADGGIAAGYTGTTAGALVASKTAIDAVLARIVPHKTLATANGLNYVCYELGEATAYSDATFLASWQASSDRHDAIAYYLNEIRRLCGTSWVGNWFDFIDGSNGVQTTGSDWGLLHKVTDTISATPRALAVSEVVQTSYTLFDPSYTVDTVISNAPSGTDAVTLPGKGLLPEATYSLSGADAAHFALSGGFSSAGGSIQTVGTNIPAGSYSVSFDQTYNGSTHHTAISITISPAATTYRYFKLSMTSSVNGSGAFKAVGFGELSIASTSGGANRLLGGTATATNNIAGKPPSQGIDGNVATSYESLGDSNGVSVGFPIVFKVDVGAGNDFAPAELKITVEGGTGAGTGSAPVDFVLTASPDDVTYTTLKTVTGATYAGNITYTGSIP